MSYPGENVVFLILLMYLCFGICRAAFLGNATNVKLLVLDSSGLRKVTAGVKDNGTDETSGRELDLIDKLGYRWTNPTLQQRIQFVQMMKQSE